MAAVEFADAGGATIKLLDVDGRYLLPKVMSAEQWYQVMALDTRSDDIFVCSYPKSGTHWVWEIIMMLKRGRPDPIRELMELNFLDLTPAHELEKIVSPRVMTSHRYYDELPRDVASKRCRMVYLVRDPKDVCVSLYHHMVKLHEVGYNGHFSDFVSLFLDGRVVFNSWWEHIARWSRVPEQHPAQPLLVIHFEDLKQNPVKQISRLAQFLDLHADDTLIEAIAANTNITAMIQSKMALTKEECGPFNNIKNTELIFRKGEVGDWRTWFTEQQSRQMDDVTSQKLAGAKFLKHHTTTE